MRYWVLLTVLLIGCSDSMRADQQSREAPGITSQRIAPDEADQQLIATCRHALANDTAVIADPLVIRNIVNDRRRATLARGLAFNLFWHEFVHPPELLDRLVSRYDIQEWFSRRTVVDVSLETWTPIDDVRIHHPLDYSYFMLTVDPDADTMDTTVYIALETKLSVNDLIAALEQHRKNDLKIVAIRTNVE